jgi:tetratricopeptide (TPR) repeat protein
MGAPPGKFVRHPRSKVYGILFIHKFWLRLRLWGILGLCVCLLVAGCASLGKVTGLATGGSTTETSKSQAYYHFLKAQQLLVADDVPGAIGEYKLALENDPDSPSLELELAALYQRQGDVKEALAHAQRSIQLDPKQQEAYFLLAGLHVGLNQLDDATREYERILRLDPDNREARLFLATLYAQQHRYPQAIHAVQELLRLDPQLVVGYYYLGRIYLETDRLADAKKEFMRVLTMDPQFVPAMFDLGATLERERQYSRALAMYRRVTRAQPRNSRAWISMARLYLIMNHYGEAQKIFQKVQELEKDDPTTNFNIALIFLEQKLPDDAIRRFRPLLSHPRFENRARYFIGMALEEKGDLKAACREYQLVDRSSEQYVQSRLRMAYLNFQMGDKERARQILNELQTLVPNQEEVYLTKSYFFEEDNQWDRAILALKAGLDKVERPAEIHFRLAVLYEKQNNREDSIEQIKKVLELDPNNADAQNFLGYTYAEKGINLDEAERLIRQALQAKPNSGQIIDSLGWVLYKKGQYGKAVAELERAHHIMPQDSTVAEHLGDAYFQQKRYRDALRIYRRALVMENANKSELNKKINQLETLLREQAH